MVGSPVIHCAVVIVSSTPLLTVQVRLAAIVRLIARWIWLVVDTSMEVIFTGIGVSDTTEEVLADFRPEGHDSSPIALGDVVNSQHSMD